ncbi:MULTISPECIES: H-NS family nucleoid-associated regulatory protein [unclassified Rhizobacter]|uniref:H-NS histone family protein n=1 Tax=unclassified Rhizobacter TaxID=2640088 RepID=UPI0007007DA6|nr:MULTISPECIES: H-NS histone family protein [unclassified Rhizobacter]KQU75640.1 histone family protein nucleoid-structuring protein H-NS [Rhizobacter sp. Root29]KQW07419.1 histone family protein nucleoid-structuring protein H-NS [Rhizobacter sp. Root1238]KRB18074.1 histone family protein nucleoid-structuring protein H-NS [Rhizobacter sp. Root16D2]
MTTLQDLLAKKAALEQEIEATQKRERQDAIAKVKSLMNEYGLSPSDLTGKSSTKTGGKAGASKGGKVAAKFRNNATGETWSGRGLQPKWLKAAVAAGKKLEDFAL